MSTQVRTTKRILCMNDDNSFVALQKKNKLHLQARIKQNKNNDIK